MRYYYCTFEYRVTHNSKAKVVGQTGSDWILNITEQPPDIADWQDKIIATIKEQALRLDCTLTHFQITSILALDNKADLERHLGHEITLPASN